MTRFAAVFTLCALCCALVAASSSATSLVVKDPRGEAEFFAKRKFIKEWRKTTNSNGLSTNEVRAFCRTKKNYWVCGIKTKDGACQGKLRVYGEPGKFTAPQRNMKIACAADPVVATPF